MLDIQKQGQHIRRYEAPASVEDALRLLDQYAPHARLIAGGTDLLIELERNQRPGIDTLIDITRIPNLNQIEVNNGRVILGCTVTHNQVVDSDIILQGGFPLAQAAWEIGSPQLRNRATVVGNLVTASPANDTITPLIALDAVLHIRSTAGQRQLPLKDFYTGVRRTLLQPNEMITHIEFPALTAAQRGIYVKLGLRRAQAISVIHLAIRVEKREDGRYDSVQIALGSVAPTIVRAAEAENILNDTDFSDAVLEQAAAAVGAQIRPIDDLRATAAYRSRVISVMVKRALLAIRSGQERAEWPEEPILLNGQGDGTFPTGSEYATSCDDDEMIHSMVNGQPVEAPHAAGKTLLRWLREDVRLADGNLAIGTKEGCAEGECGACTCFLDGQAVMACLVPAGRAAGAEITTIEGIGDDADEGEAARLSALQKAFVEAGAVQCGYCIPGFIMSGTKLLEESENPTPDQIQMAFSGNLCRCTGYYKIVEAVHNAVGK